MFGWILIMSQSSEVKNIKNNIKLLKLQQHQENLQKIRLSLNEKQQLLNTTS